VSAAPDYFEPFVAWRVWKVVRSDSAYTLGSVIQPTLWRAGEPFAAECRRGRHRLTRLIGKDWHQAPEEDCVCGIYAGRLEGLGTYLAEAVCRGVARVLGQVALWGTVVECERGFRASRAYPVRIYVPADTGATGSVDWEDVSFDLARYGVPVELLASSASEAPDVLAARRAA
jgi:hypothetical protein